MLNQQCFGVCCESQEQSNGYTGKDVHGSSTTSRGNGVHSTRRFADRGVARPEKKWATTRRIDEKMHVAGDDGQKRQKGFACRSYRSLPFLCCWLVSEEYRAPAFDRPTQCAPLKPLQSNGGKIVRATHKPSIDRLDCSARFVRAGTGSSMVGITEPTTKIIQGSPHPWCFQGGQLSIPFRTSYTVLPRRNNYRGHEPGHSHVLPNLGKGSG